MVTAIYICPLVRLEETVQETGARYVITAINPWSVPETPASVLDENHLRLVMNDIETPHDGLVHPEAHHIQQLLDFAKRWNKDGPLVVHCLAGISRSSASAFIVACALNPDASENTIARSLRKASSIAQPNRLLIELADQLLERNGRMIAAIESMSPAGGAIESNIYSISSCF